MEFYNLIKEEFNALFERRADDIHAKYYASIPQDVFVKIISADPTTPIKSGHPDKLGRYSQWLLRLFLNNNLRLEDLYKATDYLKIFDRYKQHDSIKIKDINKIKTLPDLWKNVQPVHILQQQGHTFSSSEEEARIKSNEAKKLYEDNKWLVVVPLTERAACYYGRNTQWCTAAKNDNAFDSYNSRGKLFINIDRINNKKYQFHFEDAQFMDENDNPIDIKEFFTDNEQSGLLKFYADQVLETYPNGIKHSFLTFTRQGNKHVIICEDGYEDFAEFFPVNMDRSWLSAVLSGDEDKMNEVFDYSNISAFRDPVKWKRYADDANLTKIKYLADKYSNNDAIVQGIGAVLIHAGVRSQEQTDATRAYNVLISAIHSNYGVIRSSFQTVNNTDDKNSNSHSQDVLILEIQNNFWEFFILMSAIGELGPHQRDNDPFRINLPFKHKFGGFMGNPIDPVFFNKQLSTLLNKIN